MSLWAQHLSDARDAVKTWRARSTAETAPVWEEATDIFVEAFGELRWRVEGLLIEKALCVVAADPKASKTWLLLELAIAQATCTKAFGRYEAAEGASMMFLTEDSRRSLRNRMRSLLETRGVSLDVAESALAKISFRIRQQLDLCNWEDVAALVASVYAAKTRPAMLCLDPLRNLHDSDEDKSSEMRQVMASLRCIRDLCECAVVFAHHNSKPSANADKRAAAHRMRGSSAIHGAVDGLINLIDTEAGPNFVDNDVVVVLKDARGAGQFHLRLDIVDDAQGEAVKATWKVSDVDGDGGPRRSAPAKVTPQQQLDAETKVVAYLATSNQRLRQAGQAVVHYSKRALLEAVRSKLDQGLRTDAFFAVLDDMVDRGKLALFPSRRADLPLYNVPTARLGVIDGGTSGMIPVAGIIQPPKEPNT